MGGEKEHPIVALYFFARRGLQSGSHIDAQVSLSLEEITKQESDGRVVGSMFKFR